MIVGRSPLVLSTLALVALGAVACGGGPAADPPEVVRAKQVLDEAWGEGGTVAQLSLSLFAGHPGLAEGRARLEEALKSSAPASRLEAVRALGAWGTNDVIPLLKPLVADASPAVAAAAARVLAGLGDATGRDFLAANVRDSNGNLQPETCVALAKLDAAACVSEALKDLGAKDASTSANAAATLGLAGGNEAREALRKALKAAHGERRAPIIEALGRAGDPAQDIPYLMQLSGYRESAVSVVRALGYLGGDVAIGELRRFLGLDDPGARVEAAIALLRAGVTDADVVSALTVGTTSDQAGLRYLVASNAAGLTKTPELEALVAGLAGDPEASVRAAAIRALRETPGAAALQGARFAWDAGKEAQEGAAYEAALDALVVAARTNDGDDAKAILMEALESPNWAYSLRAAMGILERHAKLPAPSAG